MFGTVRERLGQALWFPRLGTVNAEIPAFAEYGELAKCFIFKAMEFVRV